LIGQKNSHKSENEPWVSLPYLYKVYDIKIKIGFHHKSRDICDTKSPKTSKMTKNSCIFALKHIKPGDSPVARHGECLCEMTLKCRVHRFFKEQPKPHPALGGSQGNL
jgi:hypothetical protein